jgi:glyoxylase-like metal-dependent hydrolase (beta-lactamase superfamily II)
MILKHLTVGPIQANCYVLGCEETREAAVIDPGEEGDRILQTLAEDRLVLKYIINTHGHFDHAGANARLKKATGADILIHSLDAHMLPQLSDNAMLFGLESDNSPPADRTLEHGDTVSFGTVTLEILHTPGHTEGGISLCTGKAVFAGDTLFAGSVGRTDFPGGDMEILKRSIRDRLFTLDDDVTVYPGHMDITSIGAEKKYNPFVRP